MTDSASSTIPPRSSPLALIGLCLSAGLFLSLYWHPLADTLKICWENEDYSHGLLLPFISGYLAWQIFTKDRKAALSTPPDETKIPALPFTTPGFSFLGALLLVFGIIFQFLGQASDLPFFGWFGFFPALIGLLFLSFGRTIVLPYVGAILLNFMAKPLPDALVPKLFFPLQVLAAHAGARTLEWLQVPVYLKGNIIEIPGMQLMVEEACSGLRSLMALMTVAVIVLLTVEIPRWAKALILLLAVVIAIVLNVVRVAATGVLAHFFDPRAATGFFHTFSGMVVFLIGLVILYSVGGLIERISQRGKNT